MKYITQDQEDNQTAETGPKRKSWVAVLSPMKMLKLSD